MRVVLRIKLNAPRSVIALFHRTMSTASFFFSFFWGERREISRKDVALGAIGYSFAVLCWITTGRRLLFARDRIHDDAFYWREEVQARLVGWREIHECNSSDSARSQRESLPLQDQEDISRIRIKRRSAWNRITRVAFYKCRLGFGCKFLLNRANDFDRRYSIT